MTMRGGREAASGQGGAPRGPLCQVLGTAVWRPKLFSDLSLRHCVDRCATPGVRPPRPAGVLSYQRGWGGRREAEAFITSLIGSVMNVPVLASPVR
jgi:hypothetical protein